MKSDMALAVMQLAAERSLPQHSVVSAFQDAIAAAYRRDPAAEDQDVQVHIDPDSGDVVINTVLHVVDVIDEFEPRGQVTLDEARNIKTGVEVGDDIITGYLEFTPQRIAARTVTQVLMQRLRNAERRLVFEEYVDKEGEIISAPVRRVAAPRSEEFDGSRPTVFVDLGKADAMMPSEEQTPNERYRTGMEMKFFVLRVSDASPDGEGAPEIIVSRRHPMLLRRLMELEVPEVKSGLVEIKAIARHPGARSKIAVYSNKSDIDPIGACVGLRGIRIQNIVTELMGEKIDILEWSDEPRDFIRNSLGPAQIDRVIITDEHAAEVIVPENQLSLAIGKEGQNVTLATRLTNFRIDIKGAAAYAEELIELQRLREVEAARVAAEEETARQAEVEEMARAEAKAAAETPVEPEVVEKDTAVAAEVEEPSGTVVDVADEELVSEDSAVDLTTEAEATEAIVEAVPPSADVDVTEAFEDALIEEPVVGDPDPTASPGIFVPEMAQPSPSTDEAETVEEEEEEDWDLELLELEEQLKELEIEEQKRAEADREAAEIDALEQDIDADELWTLPDEFQDESESEESGLRFAEDIRGYRDEDGPRSGRRGGPRRNRR